MDCNTSTSYVFSALRDAGVYSRALLDDTEECAEERVYAQAFVIPQSYCNLSDPAVALQNGTVFLDLHMPYSIGCRACRR